MALWPAQRGRMDDWSVSATARAAASGQASNLPQSVTLTQARFFMDNGTWPEEMQRLLEANTALTEEVKTLTAEIHAAVARTV